MGKYTALHDDLYSIFGGAGWIAEGIPSFPDNYTNSANLSEFIRIAILASSGTYVNIPRSAAGQLIIDIFVPAGQGLKRLNQIADRLDVFLAGKSVATALGGNTQLGVSALSPVGVDSANPSLYRGSYSISFNYFGN